MLLLLRFGLVLLHDERVLGFAAVALPDFNFSVLDSMRLPWMQHSLVEAFDRWAILHVLDVGFLRMDNECDESEATTSARHFVPHDCNIDHFTHI
jgi:hypothetical protein